ncbi:MAG: flagellar basal body P-ring formation protein FlgA [Melioribacteraceae bacterium]|nr:flagellar basal body P-ring formation protein FlgA [Melioribacteraceae bacterium]
MIAIILNMVLLFTMQNNHQQKVEKYICDKFSSHAKIEVKLLSDWEKYNDVEIDSERSPGVNGNIIYVPVRFVRNDKSFASANLAVEIKMFDEVLVATRSIKRGEVVTETDFRFRLSDVTLLREPVKDISFLKNKRVNEYVAEGEVLSHLVLDDIPAIMPGDKLTARSVIGQVEVNTTVYSRQEGKIDEVIRVRSADNKLFKARVLDNKNVLIIE